MAYRRFLTDSDYLSTMTEVGMSQLTRERHDRVIQAEQSAELSVIEYLKQHYMIEEELLVGKKIAPYNSQITYPPDVYITYDAGDGEQIYRTLTSINALKRPTDKVYWEELMDFEVSDIKFDDIPFYSQMITWKKGDLVKFNQSVWKCVNGNGIDFNNIQIPGVVAWKKLDTYEWHANLQYEVYDVVRYDGRFFMLLETADPATMDKSINPYESDDWGMIGDYVEDYEYEVSDHEYVVFDNEVYYPVMQVNGETPEVHTNIVRDDPRNVNLVKHMTRLAIYELHKLISPTNISNVRINDYNDSIQWLRDAQKFRLDPQIPRRIDERENYPYTGWAVETFDRELDPWKQTWMV